MRSPSHRSRRNRGRRPRSRTPSTSSAPSRLPVVRRTTFLAVHGEGRHPLVTSALTGRTEPLAPDLLALLFSVPDDEWVELEPGAAVDELCVRGLLLGEDKPDLLARDRQLAADGWLPAAACFHFATRLAGVNLDLPEDQARVAREADAAVAPFVERHGPPPPHFHAREGERIVLPRTSRRGDLFAALAARTTARAFASEPIAEEQLALLLQEVFGCRATLELHPLVVALRKSSPSAGGLHPIEAYPVVQAVEGVSPGTYHYAVRDQKLERVADLEPGLLGRLVAGQTWFDGAAVAVVLAARFRRSFWKYRRSPTAYATLLMDAAHLSQTWYLVATELGLGAFVTDVIDHAASEELLGLDPWEEGALAIVGCGVRSSDRSPLEPEFTPYVPR